MNAHNEQSDPASPVVKQNLTTQPAAAQEAVAEITGINGRNGVEIHWLEGPAKIGDLLYATPVAAAPVIDASPKGEDNAVLRVADHMAQVIDYIGKRYPDAAMLDRGPIIRNIRQWEKRLRAVLVDSPKGDDVAGTLRLLLNERNYRTDGDLQTLADRCLHLSREDRDVIAMRGTVIEKLQQRIAKDSPKGGSEAREHWLDRMADIEGRPRPEPEPDEVEEVIACLGDDAAAMLNENPEDERALNMQRAADLLAELQANSHGAGVSGD